MRRLVGQAHAAIWIALVMWFVAGTNVVSARAVEESGRASVSKSAQSGQYARAAADEEDEEEEEESFFSNGSSVAKSKVAAVNPRTAPVVSSAPRVDVLATCAAVLADNQSYYNARFLDGCKRVVAQNGRH